MKSSKRFLAAATLAASMLLPLVASAAMTTDTGTMEPKPRMFNPGAGGDLFCSRITTASGEHMKKIDAVRTELDGKMGMRGPKSDRRVAQDGKLKELRGNQDGQREAMYEKMNEKAQSDEQKAASAAFQAAVEAAVTARRAAIDAANTAFHSGIDAAVTARQAAMADAITSFEAAVKAAGDKAKSDCAASDADAAKIREAYMTSVKTAKAALMTARQATDKVSASVQPLIAAHKAAIEAAQKAFKEAVMKATYDVKSMNKA